MGRNTGRPGKRTKENKLNPGYGTTPEKALAEALKIAERREYKAQKNEKRRLFMEGFSMDKFTKYLKRFHTGRPLE